MVVRRDSLSRFYSTQEESFFVDVCFLCVVFFVFLFFFFFILNRTVSNDQFRNLDSMTIDASLVAYQFEI